MRGCDLVALCVCYVKGTGLHHAKQERVDGEVMVRPVDAAPYLGAAREDERAVVARRQSHKWAFRPGMRAGAVGWRASAKAIDRLNQAKSEIRAVNRADPVTAAEGVVVLAERIWPAFEQIDTSSGALGSAVRRTLEDLVPVLIDAPADEPTRAHWLKPPCPKLRSVRPARSRVAQAGDGVAGAVETRTGRAQRVGAVRWFRAV